MKLDPEKEQDAIRLAKGPAGEILSKHAAHYTKAVFFGDKPSKNERSSISSGSVTLIRLPTGYVAVTCWHVIEQYRTDLYLYKRMIAQIGDVVLDPLAQLLDESEELDLAVIRLTEKQATKVIANS